MVVCVAVGSFYHKIGSGDFFYSFFSTIACRLEKGEWGSVYPSVMTKLYEGKVALAEVDALEAELHVIAEAFRKMPPDQAVWNFDDQSEACPWVGNLSEDVVSLYDVFICSSGDMLFPKIEKAINRARTLEMDLTVESL